MEKSKFTASDVLEQLYDNDSDFLALIPMAKKVKMSTLIGDYL